MTPRGAKYMRRQTHEIAIEDPIEDHPGFGPSAANLNLGERKNTRRVETSCVLCKLIACRSLVRVSFRILLRSHSSRQNSLQTRCRPFSDEGWKAKGPDCPLAAAFRMTAIGQGNGGGAVSCGGKSAGPRAVPHICKNGQGLIFTPLCILGPISVR